MDFPLLPPSRHASPLRQTLTAFNLQIVFRSVYETFCGIGGFIFVTFILTLGIEKEKIGYLTSAVSFACIFQMAGLIALNRLGSPKQSVIRLAFIEPLLFITGILTLPHLPPSFRLPLLGLCVFLSASLLNLTRPLTDDWLALSIPGSIRGRYLGRRLQLSSVSLLLSLAAAGVLARLTPNRPSSYALLLSAGACFGLLAVLALARAHLPPAFEIESFRPSDFTLIVRNRRFCKCLMAQFLYNLPFWFAMPFYQVFYLRILHMSEIHIAGLLTCYYLVKIFSSAPLGRWLDRTSPRHLMFWMNFSYLLLFFAFVISTPHRSWPLWVAWAITGVGDGGYFLALTQTLYQAVPDQGARKLFFVANNLQLMISGAVLTALASVLAQSLRSTTWHLGPWTLTQFPILYFLCFLAFIPCGFLSLLFLPGSSEQKESP